MASYVERRIFESTVGSQPPGSVVDPGLEMRRLAGKVAILLAGVYGLVVVAVLSDQIGRAHV